MKRLHPLQKPFNEQTLQVSPIHHVFYAEYGDPDGVPVLWLHGGPGGSNPPTISQFFDKRYHLITVDQRGCGRSYPLMELKENNTQALINDCELLRKQLNIGKWIVAGGSWGSTLALAYAEKHPRSVSRMVLVAVSLGDKKHIDWLYKNGARRIFPEAWQNFIQILPAEKRNNVITAYHQLLSSPDKEIREKAILSWASWESTISTLVPTKELLERCQDPKKSCCFSTIANHYFYHNCFLEDDELIKNIDKIKHIPTTIIHGRYDMVCLLENSWLLQENLSDVDLHILPKNGHYIPIEKEGQEKMVEILDELLDKV